MATATAAFQLELFGGFALHRADGTALQLPAAKGRALVAYLVLTAPKRQSRERIADLLWTDSAPEQARASLRQTLARIRRAIGDGAAPFVSDGDTLGLAEGVAAADVSRFRALEQSGDPADWQRALDLYGGELLSGFVIDAPAFDEWILIERQRFANDVSLLARRLLQHHAAAGSWAAAIAVGQRLLALDRLQEDVHRALIEIHARSGRADLAHRQYAELRTLLRQELDAAPDEETEALVQSIAARPGGPPRTAATAPAGLGEMAVGFLRQAAERAHHRGAHREAATLYRQSLQLVAAGGGTDAAAELALRGALRRDLYALGEFDAALEQLQRISHLARATDDRSQLARSECDRAQVLRVLGEADAATAAARQALALARSQGDPYLEALCTLRLGTLHFAAGGYLRALPLFVRNVETLGPALDGVRDEFEPGDAAVRSRSWLVWCCAELGRFSEGAAHGRDAIELADRSGEMYVRIHARIADGVLHLRAADWPRAVAALEEARGLMTWSEAPIFEAFIIAPLSLALAMAGETAAAAERLDGFRPGSDKAILLCTLADAQRLCGRVGLAGELAARALERAVVAGEKGDEAWSRRSVALVDMARGDPRSAARGLKVARRSAARLGMAPLERLCRDELEAMATA